MVRLGRQVRFSINPFLDGEGPGFNAYASKPPGQALAVFLELAVELIGPVDADTGFLVNVTEIDRAAQAVAVPVFARRIGEHFRRGEHVGFALLAGMLGAVHGRLADLFDSATVDRLTLYLNPFRKITMNATDGPMIYFSETFEFAAMHKLWNESFSAERNIEVFGKCAHPTGHGHNYRVEVTVQASVEAGAFEVGAFEHTVDSELIQLLDHKNLNADVPAFGERNPTVENLAVFAWDRLVDKLDPARLHCVTVWESDRTYCSCYGAGH